MKKAYPTGNKERIGIEASIIRRWGYAYDTFGEEGIEEHNSDLCNYPSEFKQ